jgi:hypothetical protein
VAEPAAAPNASAEPLSGTVPELDCKLGYLITERGDRRQGEVARKKIKNVTSQDALAQELGVDNGAITRWRQANRIPKLSFYTPLIAMMCFGMQLGPHSESRQVLGMAWKIGVARGPDRRRSGPLW